MDEQEQVLSRQDACAKAHDLLNGMQDQENKNHALLLVYDPQQEAFQMVAINSDEQEVVALVLSCLATLRESIKNASEDRTLN